jgi:hypothetical protein
MLEVFSFVCSTCNERNDPKQKSPLTNRLFKTTRLITFYAI